MDLCIGKVEVETRWPIRGGVSELKCSMKKNPINLYSVKDGSEDKKTQARWSVPGLPDRQRQGQTHQTRQKAKD